jgi:hypothetical protein
MATVIKNLSPMAACSGTHFSAAEQNTQLKAKSTAHDARKIEGSDDVDYYYDKIL